MPGTEQKRPLTLANWLVGAALIGAGASFGVWGWNEYDRLFALRQSHALLQQLVATHRDELTEAPHTEAELDTALEELEREMLRLPESERFDAGIAPLPPKSGPPAPLPPPEYDAFNLPAVRRELDECRRLQAELSAMQPDVDQRQRVQTRLRAVEKAIERIRLRADANGSGERAAP